MEVKRFEVFGTAYGGDKLSIVIRKAGETDDFALAAGMVMREGAAIASGNVMVWVPREALMINRTCLYLFSLMVFSCSFAHPSDFRRKQGMIRRDGSMRSEAFSHIAAAVAGLQTISSDFTQEKHVSMLKDPLVSSGRFVYEKPDRLYWEITKPSPAGFVVRGGKARRWEGDPLQGGDV